MTRPRGCKDFSSSTQLSMKFQHKNYNAEKNLDLDHSDVVFILQINGKMQTVVGI